MDIDGDGGHNGVWVAAEDGTKEKQNEKLQIN